MAKKILIPTDFTVESLNILRIVLNERVNSPVDVVLMYAHSLSDSITELLFYSSDDIIKKQLNSDFIENLLILKNRFESVVNSISIELFQGYTANSFRDFVYNQRVDMIFIPKSHKLKLRKNGFNPIPLIKKSNLCYYEIEWQEEVLDEYDMLFMSLLKTI